MIDPGLFDPPAPEVAPLSTAAAAADRQGVHRVTWQVIKLRKPIACEECFRLQHETSGEYGPRADAKHQRITHGNGGAKTRMALCTRHKQAWQIRDQANGLNDHWN